MMNYVNHVQKKLWAGQQRLVLAASAWPLRLRLNTSLKITMTTSNHWLAAIEKQHRFKPHPFQMRL